MNKLMATVRSHVESVLRRAVMENRITRYSIDQGMVEITVTLFFSDELTELVVNLTKVAHGCPELIAQVVAQTVYQHTASRRAA